MSFRPIGEIFNAVVARAEAMMEFQEYLATFDTDAQRRRTIYDAHCAGFINDEDLKLLLEVYGVENA